MAKHKYGLNPTPPARYQALRRLTVAASADAVYPPIDLRSLFPYPASDQGELGSCTANAVTKIIAFLLAREGLQVFMPSRLFQYWNSRSLEGSTDQDSGSSTDDALAASERFGVCPESDWPYDVSQFTVQPPADCYTEALQDLALDATAVSQDLASVYACLAAGFPLLIGGAVYESMESDAVAASGIIPVPRHGEALEGYHEWVIGGIDPGADTCWMGNSWGTSWGQEGWAEMPLRRYLLNPHLVQDIRVIRKVGPKAAVKRAMPRIAPPNGLKGLVVGGFLEHPDDGGAIWAIADQLIAMGCQVVKRSWDGLQSSDMTYDMDFVVNYSWGKAATVHAMSKIFPAPPIRKEFTIAGVPCPLFGQFDLFGNAFWKEPANVAAAVNFQVDSFPVSRPIENPGADYINVNCDGPGVNHVTIPGLASVQKAIVDGVAALVAAV